MEYMNTEILLVIIGGVIVWMLARCIVHLARISTHVARNTQQLESIFNVSMACSKTLQSFSVPFDTSQLNVAVKELNESSIETQRLLKEILDVYMQANHIKYVEEDLLKMRLKRPQYDTATRKWTYPNGTIPQMKVSS